MMERAEESVMSISDQAAEWFLRLHSGEVTIAERYEYLQWLKLSPVHIAEFLRVCRTYSWLRAMKLEPPVANEDNYSNVIELATREKQLASSPGTPRSGGWRMHAAAMLLAVGLTVLAGVVAKSVWVDHTIVTEASEWRRLTLADGSLVDVGPRTRVRSQFGDNRRVMYLSHGEMMVQVAKDAARPFIVDAGGVQVQATGTQFAVDRRDRNIIVTVAEGSVLVTHPSAGEGPASVPLNAGEQITISNRSRTPVQQVDLERVLAWVNHRLIFETETVQEAVDDFNRRNRLQIVIEPALSTYPIRGGFDADHPEEFAESLTTILPVSAPVVVVRERPNLLRVETLVERR